MHTNPKKRKKETPINESPSDFNQLSDWVGHLEELVSKLLNNT